MFTCLSHDIVAHETTHAILDGVHRRYIDATHPDTRAFHEAFSLMSAEQIGASWQERHKAKGPGWNDAWIPLLDDYQGDLVVLDPSSPGCAVRELWRGATNQPIVALTLAEWLAEFVGDVEAGLYEEDEERGEFQRMG